MQGSHEVATGLSLLDGCGRKGQLIANRAQTIRMTMTPKPRERALHPVAGLPGTPEASVVTTLEAHLAAVETAVAEGRRCLSPDPPSLL